MTVVDGNMPGGDGRLLEVAVAAHLSRYQGESRAHTESYLRVFLRWCAGQQLDPLAVGRVHIELFLRWLQETRRFGHLIGRWAGASTALGPSAARHPRARLS
jgi:hypothetical protein